MYTGKGQVVELVFEYGLRQARISCASNLVPSPGQFLQAGTDSRSYPLSVSLFSTGPTLFGFTASAPIPETWAPGLEINLRGPLGRGFAQPQSARRLTLVAFDDSPARLQGLIGLGRGHSADIVLVCDSSDYPMPDDVEILPLSSLGEAVRWADYIALDVAREKLPKLKEMMREQDQVFIKREAQVLVRTPMPCGEIASCGVCAVVTRSGRKMACKDGPVFDWREI